MDWITALKNKLTPIEPDDATKLDILGNVAVIHDDEIQDLKRRIMELERKHETTVNPD